MLSCKTKSDKTSKKLQLFWKTVQEITQAYEKVFNECFKNDKKITLNDCEQWCFKMESFLNNEKIPELYYDKYMKMIGEIHRKLESDAQLPNKPSSQNQSFMVMLELNSLKESNFSHWLKSFMMALNAANAVKAVESLLHKDDPLNLIARGYILQRVPVELQKPILHLELAYDMLLILKQKYEKKTIFPS